MDVHIPFGRLIHFGHLLLLQIAGSMAEKGYSLSDIANECRLINSKMATYGAAVTACTLTGQKPLFEIGPDEIDIGLGIHGEAGVIRTKVVRTIVITKNAIFASLSFSWFFSVPMPSRRNHLRIKRMNIFCIF